MHAPALGVRDFFMKFCYKYLTHSGSLEKIKHGLPRAKLNKDELGQYINK